MSAVLETSVEKPITVKDFYKLAFEVLRDTDELLGGDVLSDFKCNLNDIFANLPND